MPASLPSPQPVVGRLLFAKTHFLLHKKAATTLPGMTHLKTIASFWVILMDETKNH